MQTAYLRGKIISGFRLICFENYIFFILCGVLINVLQLDKKSAIMKAQKRLLVNYIKNEAPYVLMDTPRKKNGKKYG